MDDRYVLGTYEGEAAVLDQGHHLTMVIARCGVRADAEKIIAALNREQRETVGTPDGRDIERGQQLAKEHGW